MQYVDLCGNKISRLGLGCMRLPEIEQDDNKKINYPKAMEMADYAISNGINYFDTAYIYHDEDSENFIKEVITKHGRKSIFIADKLPIYFCKKEEDLQNYLDEQLERLGTDYIDYYLFHTVDKDNFNIMQKLNYKKFIETNINNGKIKHIGFSFHDDFEIFKQILDDYNWDFCQIQFNYLDTEYQAGLKGYEYATSKNIPIIVMEPIRGGRLASIPNPVKEVFNTKYNNYEDAELALRFVGNYPNIKVILSGMRRMSDLESNIKLFSENLMNKLDNNDLEIYKQAKQTFSDYQLVNCTGCAYCTSACPKNIPIPDIFSKYNEQISAPYLNINESKEWYNNLQNNAKDCIKCSSCERKCPQSLQIIKSLEIADKYLSK